jgi:hypothetical protein
MTTPTISDQVGQQCQQRCQQRCRQQCRRCQARPAHPPSTLDGPTCEGCFDRAVRVRGRCPSCGIERLLPGWRDHQPHCRDCAGITRSFTCRRCGTEARLYSRKVCIHCRLDDVAAERLDDGTGHIRADLQPLAPVLARHHNSTPQGRLLWLNKPPIRILLAALATGQLALNHQALDAYPDRRLTVEFLRELLITAGCLPDVDRTLHRFQRWLTRTLAQLRGHRYERVLRQFGTWHHLAKMHATAASRPLTANAFTYASMEITRAIEFCTWLDQQTLPLDHLPQATLDHYYGTLAPARQQALCGFLTWAMTAKQMPRLAFTRPRFRVGEALTQHDRLTLLRTILTTQNQPLAARVAGCLLLLYAQPIPRIQTLQTSHIIRRENEVLLRLGEPATPVPEPFATLLLQLADTHTTSQPWLFPGRHPGQPASYATITHHLRDLGIPLRQARTAAIRHLVLDVPAPITAAALGFHHTTTHRQLHHAGGVWNRYITTRT